MTFFDGHDELYHRITVQSLEKIVQRAHKAKNQVFRPSGATRCTDAGQTLQGRRAPGSAWLCKILPQSAQRCGNAAQKYQKLPLFGKESPSTGESLDRLLKVLRVFIRPSMEHQYFKFDVIRCTGYGVIAENRASVN